MPRETAGLASRVAERVAGLSSATVDRPVLVYFDIIGICWPIRCLLHLRDVDYEHVVVPLEAWAFRSGDGRQPVIESFRNGHVPLYVDPDVYLTQSNVIMTHLADRHGLMGDAPAERLAIMEVMAHAYDALFHWSGLMQVIVRHDTPDDVVASRLQAFLGNGRWGVLTNGYHRNLRAFERYLDANPLQDSGFMVGGRLSVADLHAYNVLCNWYKAFDRSLFAGRYPRLDDYLRRLAAIPKIAEYVREHQEATTWFPYPGMGLRLTTPEELAGLP